MIWDSFIRSERRIWVARMDRDQAEVARIVRVAPDRNRVIVRGQLGYSEYASLRTAKDTADRAVRECDALYERECDRAEAAP